MYTYIVYRFWNDNYKSNFTREVFYLRQDYIRNCLKTLTRPFRLYRVQPRRIFKYEDNFLGYNIVWSLTSRPTFQRNVLPTNQDGEQASSEVSGSQGGEYVKLIAYWDIAPCSLVETDWRFRNAHCLQNQDNEQAASEISDSHGGENEEDSLLEYRAGQSADYRPSEGGSTHYWNVDLRLFYSYVIYFITIFVSN
jgi:hypothetical protein